MSADAGPELDVEKWRRRLEAERERLRSTLDSADADERGYESGEALSTADQHPADIGTETENLEESLSIADSVQAELDDVAAALVRLDEGTYGRCQACGRPIGVERLEALPATRFCIEDEGLAEAEALGRRTLPSDPGAAPGYTA